jgi:primase-polymerase (primpol)-like protein
MEERFMTTTEFIKNIIDEKQEDTVSENIHEDLAYEAAQLLSGSFTYLLYGALWGGQRRHGNESADDIALMNKLAYWCNADTDAMVRAFLSSPHYAQKDEAHIKKCKRVDYLPNTAMRSSSTVYSTAAADYERFKQRKRNMERSFAK